MEKKFLGMGDIYKMPTDLKIFFRTDFFKLFFGWTVERLSELEKVFENFFLLCRLSAECVKYWESRKSQTQVFFPIYTY